MTYAYQASSHLALFSSQYSFITYSDFQSLTIRYGLWAWCQDTLSIVMSKMNLSHQMSPRSAAPGRRAQRAVRQQTCDLTWADHDWAWYATLSVSHCGDHHWLWINSERRLQATSWLPWGHASLVWQPVCLSRIAETNNGRSLSLTGKHVQH